MDLLYSCEDLRHGVSGEIGGNWHGINSVVIDSRKANNNSLFIALKGAKSDGHDFAREAISNGATAVMINKSRVKEFADINYVAVDDSEESLCNLARFARKRSKAKFIGITGSTGKTGAKEMLKLAMSNIYRVYANKGNLNNHIGLPISICNIPLDIEYGIFEAGMNHAGEISMLSKILRPDISMITNIGEAHIGFFELLTDIAKAKSEIFDGMTRNKGMAMLNRDDENYDLLSEKAKSLGIEIRDFGVSESAQYRMNKHKISKMNAEINANINGSEIDYEISVIDKHWAVISLGVLGIMDYLGSNAKKSAKNLIKFSELEGRGKIFDIKIEDKKILLLDDSYNANPLSMKAAIEKLNIISSGIKRARRVAILGDMLELGSHSNKMHCDLLVDIEKNKVEKIYAVGKNMKNLYDILPENIKGKWVASYDSLLDNLPELIENGDVILVKGSFGSNVYKIAERIKNYAI